MANYKFTAAPRKLPLWQRLLAGHYVDLAAFAVFVMVLSFAGSALAAAMGVDPSAGGTMLPALAVNYKFVDAKAGLSSSAYQGLNATRGLWVAAATYAVGDTVQNGGFLFRCSVAGIAAAAPGPSPNTLVDNAVTWVLVGPTSGACIQDSTQQHELGYQSMVKDDTYGIATLIYVKFTGVTVAGDWVIFDNQGKTCTQTPVATPGASKFSKIGISMGSQINGSYGWVMIQGVHDQANVTAGGTVGNLCAGVGTLGRSTTVQTANYVFDGTVLRVAGVVGTGTVELWWPTCSGR